MDNVARQKKGKILQQCLLKISVVERKGERENVSMLIQILYFSFRNIFIVEKTRTTNETAFFLKMHFHLSNPFLYQRKQHVTDELFLRVAFCG